MQEKKDLAGRPDYSTPLSEAKIEKQEIHNYGMQWDKDQKLLTKVKEKEDFFQVPSDEEMMEILNPIYVY